MRKILWTVLVMISLLGAAPLAAQNVNGSRRQLERGVFAVPDFTNTPRSDALGRLLMRLPSISRTTLEASLEQLPPQLLSLAVNRNIDTSALLSLDAQGRPIQCRMTRLEVLEDYRQVPPSSIEPELAEVACDVATRLFQYHAALDQTGQTVPSELMVKIQYDGWRLSFLNMPRDPASRVEISGGWLPQFFSAGRYHGLPLMAPQGRNFLAEDRNRPRRADVGVVVSYNRSGDVVRCRVVMSSGIEAYDAVSCPALSSMHQFITIADIPLLMRWNRREVRLIDPVDPHGPELIQPVAPLASMIVGIQIPESPVVVDLTVSPDGRLQSCVVDQPSFTDAIDVASCALFGPETRFTQPRGVFGEATVGRLALTIDWRDLSVQRNRHYDPRTAPPARLEN